MVLKGLEDPAQLLLEVKNSRVNVSMTLVLIAGHADKKARAYIVNLSCSVQRLDEN